tara:strand:+ start:231 stop:437 length:207 start_codon:yes stop_codon:yes gene_type:complete
MVESEWNAMLPKSRERTSEARFSKARQKGKISYIHNNPGVAGLVYKAHDNIYGNASDYADEKGLLDGI